MVGKTPETNVTAAESCATCDYCLINGQRRFKCTYEVVRLQEFITEFPQNVKCAHWKQKVN